MRPAAHLATLLGVLLSTACGAPLPDDIAGWRDNCVRMNAQPIPPYEDDPHEGTKNVYACNIGEAELRDATPPYPDGTVIVKESTREGDDYVWLLATGRKDGGAWTWDEYTRNFDGEDFARIAVSSSFCQDCHDNAAGSDFIYSHFEN